MLRTPKYDHDIPGHGFFFSSVAEYRMYPAHRKCQESSLTNIKNHGISDCRINLLQFVTCGPAEIRLCPCKTCTDLFVSNPETLFLFYCDNNLIRSVLALRACTWSYHFDDTRHTLTVTTKFVFASLHHAAS